MSKSHRSPLVAAGEGGSGTDFRRLEMMARAEEFNLPIPKLKGKGKRSNSMSTSVVKKGKKTCFSGSKESAWVERFLPTSLADHFVHKSKISQFVGWLQNAENPRGSKMCLLTGPSGAGKTATVYLVAAELGYQVKEWLNPMSLTSYRSDGWKDSDEIQGRSLIDLFTDYLLRASRYTPLPVKGKTRPVSKTPVILVEDFPNFFYTDIPLLHQLMRNYQANVNTSPLVFAMTNTASPDCSSFKLFPKSLLIELKVQEITLNPVAPSFITKFANQVLSQATNSEKCDASLVADIVASSGGDMRATINSLQFRLQVQENNNVHWSCDSRPVPKKRKLNVNEKDRTFVHSKDESLFLFHAVGKVLYCKRESSEVVESEVCDLKGNAATKRRVHPLKEVPDEIGSKIGVSAETFFNFLTQNYLTFFNSLSDVVTASASLADAAVIFSRWTADDTSQNFLNKSDTREELALSVAIRGLMFSNQTPVGSTWKPLNKPKLRDVSVFAERMIQNTHTFCTGPVTQDYFTDLVPYTAMIRSDSYKVSPEKRDFLDEFGRFKSNKRNTTSILEEGNGAGVDNTVTFEYFPTPNVQEDTVHRGTVPVIEEYDIEEILD